MRSLSKANHSWLRLFLVGQFLMGCTLPVTDILSTNSATATPTSIVLSPISSSRAEVAGVLTATEGTVTLHNTSAPETASEIVNPLQRISYGTTIVVDAGGRATIICNQDRLYQLDGPGTITLQPDLCANGEPLPTGSTDSVTQEHGRIHFNSGSKVLEGPTRALYDDLGKLPIVLAPRNSGIFSVPLTIGWTAVPDAIRYELHLLNSTEFPEITLSAEEVACTPHPDLAPHAICTVAWPETWPLTVDHDYFLTVRVLKGIGQPWLSSDPSAFWTVDAATEAQVNESIQAFSRTTLDMTTTQLILADRYQGMELYHAAIAAYETAVTAQPSTIAHIALGDLYLLIDLPFLALFQYQQAELLLNQPIEAEVTWRAAAAFGMGLAYYQQQEYAAAVEQFSQAGELYAAGGAEEEAIVAQQRQLDAEARLPTN